ncbi:MAG: hypothetical protein HFI07_01035 [Lachnospiraceae bacterium]|nr:hypothetical protein [Lachnospiraceae bacterium]
MSKATIGRDLREIRGILKKFEIHIRRNRNIVFLTGDEKNKRNLMSHLISSDSYDSFVLNDGIRMLAFHIDACFENNVQEKKKVSCVFIYADYYSIHKNLLDQLMAKDVAGLGYARESLQEDMPAKEEFMDILKAFMETDAARSW